MNGDSDDPVRVRSVHAVDSRRLRVGFIEEVGELQVDLTGLIARSRNFAPLMDDPQRFAAVRVVEHGLGVAWPVETKWGRLDISAATLRRIAEEQQPMTGEDFAAWRSALGLSLTEAAAVLGMSRRTVMGLLKKPMLPTAVAIACRALAADKQLLAAHFVPARELSRRAA